MAERVRIPWWLIATVALLGAALGIAIANGRIWDALIIGVLFSVGLVLVGAALFFHWKSSRGEASTG